MSLAVFIKNNHEQILSEWQSFAQSLGPAADSMSQAQLRDHAKEILDAIAGDLESYQSEQDQADKSKGEKAGSQGQWAAAIHGKLRYEAGFSLPQLTSEYRALRASVIRLWSKSTPDQPSQILRDMTRFNEAIDEALADSILKFSDGLSRSRDTFIGMLGHDLRSPLNTVSVTAQHLSTPSMTDAQRLAAGSRITRAVKSMSGMIGDLLEFARSSLGGCIPIRAHDCNLGVLCRTAVEDTQLWNPGHVVRIDLSGNLDGTFDEARIQQVLSNLVTIQVSIVVVNKMIKADTS